MDGGPLPMSEFPPPRAASRSRPRRRANASRRASPMSDFRHRAACRDSDPELFFPVGDRGPARRQIAAAKTVCGRCPVAEECLTWALHARPEEGVWGGRDMAERGVLHRRTRTAGVRPRA